MLEVGSVSDKPQTQTEIAEGNTTPRIDEPKQQAASQQLLSALANLQQAVEAGAASMGMEEG